MKELKDYLPFYVGCQIWEEGNNKGELLGFVNFGGIWNIHTNCSSNDPYWSNISLHKLILRPLSDMTDDEMIELIQHTTPEGTIVMPYPQDYDLAMFYNDGGNMVDTDVAVGCNYSCMCYEGQLAIRKCGSVHFFDEAGNPINACNMPKIYTYLLSKHFDLFGLVEAGLAIDKTTIIQNA